MYKFNISKTKNLFACCLTLLDNDAPNIKQSWRKQLNRLTREDWASVKWLKNNLQQELAHPDLIFTARNDREVWGIMNKISRRGELEKFRQSSLKISKKLDGIWYDIKDSLKNTKKYLNKNETIMNQTAQSISNLTATDNDKIKNTPVHLMLNFHDLNNWAGWFSYTPKNQSIVLEAALKTSAKNLFPLAIFCHEIFHLEIRRNHGLYQLIKKTAGENSNLIKEVGYKNGNPSMILEELIVSSFIPEGYLGQKYYSLSLKKISGDIKPSKDLLQFSKTRKQCAYIMRDIARKYTINKRPIDKNYIDELIGRIREKINKG